jgi:hypothetical protein
MWIPLVNKFGGIHHGYFLPHEGANNIGYALFSFPSLAEWKQRDKNQPKSPFKNQPPLITGTPVRVR